VEQFLGDVVRARRWTSVTSVRPERVNEHLRERGTGPLAQAPPLRQLLKRPQVDFIALVASDAALGEAGFEPDVLTLVEMEVKYEGYLERERKRVESLRRRESMPLPGLAPYLQMRTLSIEARQKLDKVRPRTLGQASRIPGISLADLQNLLVELKKRELRSGRPEGC
jgi:tRNA uridine 5-carboxymethylaminomethyl modification enzyme